ncbi:hypothetical protein A8H39_17160 [Paraburkholderia fungorum]|nr:hypothetical protein A8H39_17160 [Paraburkholderia fungorum]
MAFCSDGTRAVTRAHGARAGLVEPLYKGSADRAARTFYRIARSAYYRTPARQRLRANEPDQDWQGLAITGNTR